MNLNIFNVYNKSKSESAGPTEIDYKRINVIKIPITAELPKTTVEQEASFRNINRCEEKRLCL